MPTAEQIQQAINNVNDQRSFVNGLLRETLNWPISLDFDSIDGISYDWTEEDLNAAGLTRDVLAGPVLQMQSLEQTTEQPWGIFILEFANDAPFTTGRGLTGPLRKVLRGLVTKRRDRRANLPSFQRENLLFICTNQYRHFRFAYFKAPQDNKVAPLITFGWGPGIPARTACEFNLPALVWPGDPSDRNTWVSRWAQAFDKERLSKLFFDQYKALFDILRKDLASQTDDLPWAHDFALQFLNRIMFLYFIQRKGWIGENTEFLAAFWREYRNSGQPSQTFFDKWLKVLFFEAFNGRFNAGHAHFSPGVKQALSLAPYLNGGLFTENDLDRAHDITITDERIGQLLSFFERFNFTVSEDTPLDRDVAVDPEMIGMVYESLVNISEDEDRRGEAGIFYTPRVEIDLMCRLTLVDWLGNHLGPKCKPLLYRWVFALDEPQQAKADEEVLGAKLLDPLKGLLNDITVVDPACGSGSFLVGMLHVLDNLRERLEKHEGTARSSYDRRKEIIGSNLYGVDIKDWACHVAELRLWLSLIIDADMTPAELHVRKKPLLPNFTFNIRCGDSLVQEVGGVDMAHRRGSLELSHAMKLRLAELRREKSRFYNNEPQRKYGSADDLRLLEVKIFGELLEDRIRAAKSRAKELMRIQAEKTDHQQRDLLTGELEGPARQFTLNRQQREAEIAALGEEIQRLEATLRSLDKTTVPFVWDIAFAEIFGGEKDGFDIVIGNPPYVRQEHIADPAIPRHRITADNKKAYKAKLARTVYKTYREYFGYKDSTDKAARAIDKKSDLYIYFYFKGLSLLNDRGSFCFITSNSWLDVGYGADLQEFLLRRCHVKMVLDNKAKRSFKSADVNTVIVLLGPPLDRKAAEEAALSNTARFVMFHVPFEDAVSADTFTDIEKATGRAGRDTYRVFAGNQQHLFEEGLESLQQEQDMPKRGKKAKSAGVLVKSAKYIGNKWGGKYLRAPDIYFKVLDHKGAVCSFGQLAAHIQRNNMQGLLDRQFVLRGEAPDGFPFLHSVKDVQAIRIDRDKLPKVIPSRGQKRAKWLIPDVISNRFIGERLCFFEGGDFVVNDSFFIATLRAEYRKHTVLALLNSTLSLMTLEVRGRKNMGEGVLCIYGPELWSHQIVDPKVLSQQQVSELEKCYESVAVRPVLPIFDEVHQPDRRDLDSVAFDALHLTKGERDAVYQALVELVQARLSKASSLKPEQIVKRLDAVNATAGIWSGAAADISDADEEEE